MPVILAPLSGGPGSPELVAACCNSGIFGFYGGAYLSAEDLRKDIQKIKSLTKKPFGINLFVPSANPAVSDAQIQKALRATRKYRSELGLPDPVVGSPAFENWQKQMDVVLSEQPAIFSFTFGLIPGSDVRRLQKAGIEVVGTATTLEEARSLEVLGVDAVCLQGTEAGGHRGIFDIEDEEPDIAMMDLLEQCLAVLETPLIAAGGIMNGADVAGVIKTGAVAAQMGTAFLLCPEAGTAKPYREALKIAAQKRSQTKLTRAFSGRLARGLENRFMREMQKEEILPWPTMNFFTRDLRKKSAELGSADFLSLWAGSGVEKIRELSAAELIQILEEEFQAASA